MTCARGAGVRSFPAPILQCSRMAAERRKTQQWEFLQDRGLRWYWRRLKRDNQADKSAGAFSSRTDCIADAMSHGYLGTLPWVSR